jgi:hypothetical protein
VAISGVVDTCSISTGDGWTEGTGKGIRGSNHRLDTVSCGLRSDQGRERDQVHRDCVYTPTGDTRIDDELNPGWELGGKSRFFRESVAFLKEPGGIFRIPRNGIIKTPSPKQNPGVIGTVSIITTNTTQRTRPGHQIAIMGSVCDLIGV